MDGRDTVDHSQTEALRQQSLKELLDNLENKKPQEWLPRTDNMFFQTTWLNEVKKIVKTMLTDKNYQPKLSIPLCLGGKDAIKADDFKALVEGIKKFNLPFTFYPDPHLDQRVADQFYKDNLDVLKSLGISAEDFNVSKTLTKEELKQLPDKRVIIIEHWRQTEQWRSASSAYLDYYSRGEQKNKMQADMEAEVTSKQTKHPERWGKVSREEMTSHLIDTAVDTLSWASERKAYLLYSHSCPAYLARVGREAQLIVKGNKIDLSFQGFQFASKDSKKKKDDKKVEKADPSVIQINTTKEEGVVMMSSQEDKTKISEEGKLALIRVQFDLESAAQFVRAVGVTDGKVLGDFFNATRESREKQINAFLALLQAENKVSEFYSQIVPMSSSQSIEFEGVRSASPGIPNTSGDKANFDGRKALNSSGDWHTMFGKKRITRTTTTVVETQLAAFHFGRQI